jgi:hypothetical protein
MGRRSIAWRLAPFLLIAAVARSAPVKEVNIGGIVISVSDSWTAQVFHIVDQLAEWDDAWLAPGLIDNAEESDSLAEALVRNVLRGTPASDAYVQAYSVALVIRPLLREALDRGETITAFLPKAAAKWRRASGRDQR